MAGVLAIVFYPAHRWLLRKTGHEALTVWISTLLVGLLFLLPMGLFGLVLAREAKHAYDLVSQSLGPSGGMEWWGALIDRLSQLVGIERAQLDEMLVGRLQGIANSAVGNALKSIQGVGSWIASSVITLVTLFFMLDGGRRILDTLKEWSPLPGEMVEELFAEVEKLIFANVYGVLSVALAQGSLTGIGFWFLGLPSAIFWGAVAAVLSVLPFFGAGLVWVPAALYLFGTGQYMKGGILLAWGALVVSMADNIIRPLVLSERVQMNASIMFFALLGGVQAFGLLGLFAGPIFFSLALAVLRLLRRESERITGTGLIP